MFRGMIRYLTDNNYRFIRNAARGMYNNMPDDEYLKRMFKAKMGKELNLDKPQTFNEKIQWLKLYDRKPVYSSMVDKYEAKKYVASIIGNDYIIPTLGVWDKVEDIDFDSLPMQFVIKCTHDSHGLVICQDKETLDINFVKKKLDRALKQNYYLRFREWPYKNVKPRIIAEKYMVDDSRLPVIKNELTDYKFYCFNGVVDCVMVCYDRHSRDTKYYFFGEDWSLKRINIRGKQAPEGFTLPKPTQFNEMINIAKILSRDIPFVRIDLYQSNDRVYFGEMTFYPQSGFDSNYLPETDAYFGSKIDLSNIQ